MKVTSDVRMRASALESEPLYEQAVAVLKDRAVKDLLGAKTSEERDEKWRNYHALDRVVELVARWAAEARTQD